MSNVGLSKIPQGLHNLHNKNPQGIEFMLLLFTLICKAKLISLVISLKGLFVCIKMDRNSIRWIFLKRFKNEDQRLGIRFSCYFDSVFIKLK